MQIFIDETGNFIPGIGARVSCGAALVVPDSRSQEPFRWFDKLASRWDAAAGKEIKGSDLDEMRAYAVVDLARAYDPLLILCAIDAGSHADDEIRRLIAVQANNITKSLTDKHHPNLVKEVKAIRELWETLSPQLAVQAFTFFALVETVIRDASIYYAQRDPAALGSFSWVVDAKDPTQVTDYERVWRDLLKPFLQTIFLDNPVDALEGADYSAWDRMAFTDPVPSNVQDRLPADPDEQGSFFDLRKIMKDLRFEPTSHSGLRLVDMLAAIFRRGVVGHLQESGWRYLGRLMICKNPVVRLISLSEEPGQPVPLTNEPLLRVLRVLQLECKPMLVR